MVRSAVGMVVFCAAAGQLSSDWRLNYKIGFTQFDKGEWLTLHRVLWLNYTCLEPLTVNAVSSSGVVTGYT